MIDDAELKAQLKRVLTAVEQLLPQAAAPLDWQNCYAASWRRHSLTGFLHPVDHLDPVKLEDLLGIDSQKMVLEENTRQFLDRFPSNNALLWGTRGTGKSTLVRALLNRYAPDGLRVVQVDKDDLIDLPTIFNAIRNLPYRFILLCDDLSFESGESSYKMLKSALDGSVYAAPENVRIYVTSNRRHLLPEYETDNLGAKMVKNEIHHGEGVEEKISLSDRFGLWVAFNSFSQAQYLEVVENIMARICAEQGIATFWDTEIEQSAIAWSHSKSKRCGRTALQFAQQSIGSRMRENQI